MKSSALLQTRCAVFGAGGFIGANLCLALQERVGRLVGFGRRAPPDALQNVEWVQGDFADPDAYDAALAGANAVIHLVGASTPASANTDMIADVMNNVVATLHFLDACRRHGVQRVIFVSSGGTIYGVPDVIPTPETYTPEPITAYGVSKLAIERYLSLYRHLHGLEYRALRVANPYGPFQSAAKGQGVVAAFMDKALAGQPIEVWGDGSVVRDYVYVADVVEAIIAAMSHDGPSRVFNIGGGRGHSLNELIGAISEAVGRPIQRTEKAARIIDAPRSVLDISRAQAELGWTPRTELSDGLARALAWRLGELAKVTAPV
ncbi:NAD-dependent epimerase/dehydratase family protein [Terricaulis silvestris]|uniref:NAD-dependent epimerase/dehydratase family protein n=1 Tax=Terricaulis silvestris TaxID=2686094 RepID=UPI00131E5A8D|nr:NAD-dependent epimerase/dehydratase family protein [Terricaulis silvestris]